MKSFIVVIPFAVSLGLIFACVFLIRVWTRRQDWRSPLHGKKIPFLPGQQLTRRLAEHSEGISLAVVIMYFAMPIMLLAWAVTRLEWAQIHFGKADWLYVVAGLVLFGMGLRQYLRHLKSFYRVRDGLFAEQVTGQALDRLSGPQCRVAHDIPCEGFNIDHVLIAPHAVYAIETKSVRKRTRKGENAHKVLYDGQSLKFPGHSDTRPIEQARRQAQWLRAYLRQALDRDIPVKPAVALPGWWIDRTDTARQAEVVVFTPMGRGAEFLLRGPEILDAQQRAQIAQAIAQRYPVVEA